MSEDKEKEKLVTVMGDLLILINNIDKGMRIVFKEGEKNNRFFRSCDAWYATMPGNIAEGEAFNSCSYS